MTEEQIKQWKREREIAMHSNNPSLIQEAYNHRDDMLMECISHQSDRVKGLVVDMSDMKRDVANIRIELKPLKESDKMFRHDKIRREGFKAGWNVAFVILRYAAAIGGTAGIMKILN